MVSKYCIAALFHQPTRGRGGAADADRLDALQPLGLYLLGILDEMAVGIHAQTLVEKHLAVGTLPSADEENEVVPGGKLRDTRHAVGHGTADGVETLEGGLWRDVRLDIVDDAVELVERLRGLRVEVDVAREVERGHLVETLDDDGGGLCLTDEAKHLGVTLLAEDHDLGGRGLLITHTMILIILALDALLELEHHRTGGIDDLDVVLAGKFVGLWGFTVGTQQHLHVVEFAQVIVVDGDKAHLMEPFTLHAIVHDITEAIECLTLCQFFLGLLDGCGHTEAEATAVVDLNL